MTKEDRAEQIVKQLEDDCGKHDHRHRQNLVWVKAMIQSGERAAIEAERARIANWLEDCARQDSEAIGKLMERRAATIRKGGV